MLTQKPTSIKFLLMLAAATTLVACSTTRYTYYFSAYTTPSTALEKKIDSNNIPAASATEGEHFLLDVQKETLIASTSKDPLLLASNEVKFDSKRYDATALTVETKKGKAKKLGALKKMIVNGQDDVKGGDATKNKFAKRGLIFSILGLATLSLVFAIGFAGLFISIPLAIVGVISSSKGMKSEKHGAAITGLILGLLVFNLILVGTLAYFAMGQD